MGRDITPLLRSLVVFQDDNRGARMETAMLVEEGDTARLEADAAEVGLEAVFLQVSSTVA